MRSVLKKLPTCANCGAPLRGKPDAHGILTCEYCGTKVLARSAAGRAGLSEDYWKEYDERAKKVRRNLFIAVGVNALIIFGLVGWQIYRTQLQQRRVRELARGSPPRTSTESRPRGSATLPKATQDAPSRGPSSPQPPGPPRDPGVERFVDRPCLVRANPDGVLDVALVTGDRVVVLEGRTGKVVARTDLSERIQDAHVLCLDERNLAILPKGRDIAIFVETQPELRVKGRVQIAGSPGQFGTGRGCVSLGRGKRAVTLALDTLQPKPCAARNWTRTTRWPGRLRWKEPLELSSGDLVVRFRGARRKSPISVLAERAGRQVWSKELPVAGIDWGLPAALVGHVLLTAGSQGEGPGRRVRLYGLRLRDGEPLYTLTFGSSLTAVFGFAIQSNGALAVLWAPGKWVFALDANTGKLAWVAGRLRNTPTPATSP